MSYKGAFLRVSTPAKTGLSALMTDGRRRVRLLPSVIPLLSLARFVCAAAVAAACFAGCNHLRGGGPPEGALDGAAFTALPPAAKTYLTRLAAAWEAQDEAFLLAQGEPDYEAAMRPRSAPSRYLALLYRAGPYAESGTRDYGPFTLDIRRVKTIRFLSWREAGPVIETSAVLHLTDGSTVPCLIALLWRLPAIKIIGVYP